MSCSTEYELEVLEISIGYLQKRVENFKKRSSVTREHLSEVKFYFTI
jgi:hypothetical protein